MKISVLTLALSVVFMCLPVSAKNIDDIPTILWLSSGVSKALSFRDLGETNTPIDTNNLLLDGLSDLKFDFQTVPSARVSVTMDTHLYACATNRLKTSQRSKKYLYSQPLNLYLGLRLYSLKASGPMPAQLLNEKQQVISLRDMFEHYNERRLGVSNERSFGPALDKQIKALDPRNIMVHSGLGSLHSLLAMLLKNRIQYVIEFPVELSNSELKNKTDKLLNSYEIAGSDGYFVGHVTCKNNNTMKRVMAQINQQLNTLYTDKRFYRAHVNYLPKSDIEQFDRFFKQVFVPAMN